MSHPKPKIFWLRGGWSVRSYWSPSMTQAERMRLYEAEKWVYMENFKLHCDKIYDERREAWRDLFQSTLKE